MKTKSCFVYITLSASKIKTGIYERRHFKNAALFLLKVIRKNTLFDYYNNIDLGAISLGWVVLPSPKKSSTFTGPIRSYIYCKGEPHRFSKILQYRTFIKGLVASNIASRGWRKRAVQQPKTNPDLYLSTFTNFNQFQTPHF